MYREIFPGRIKSARIEAGLTQIKVQDITGIKQQNISKFERGTLEPNIETLGTLADLYEVSLDWLFGIGKKRNEK